VFATRHGNPFQPSNLRRDARRHWDKAGLASINPHECRHTYASLMVAAGVNANALSTYMGHASIKITLDRYGHLMPGNEEEAAGLLDSYLGGAAAG
jgi:integrase